jgi:hypothetical protein
MYEEKFLFKKTFKLNLCRKLLKCSCIITLLWVFFSWILGFPKIVSQLICMHTFTTFTTNSGSDTKLPRALPSQIFWIAHGNSSENLYSSQFGLSSCPPVYNGCFSASWCLYRSCHFLMESISKSLLIQKLPTSVTDTTGARETSLHSLFVTGLKSTAFSFHVGLRHESEESGPETLRRMLYRMHNHPSVLMLPVTLQHAMGILCINIAVIALSY